MKRMLCAAAAILAMACASPVHAAVVSGTVCTDGSTSMEKVVGALGEAFEQANPGVHVTYNPTGSGSGITAAREGRCDIGLSSRSLKDAEKQGGLTETRLALDGIAIIVNPANGIANITRKDLAGLFTGSITSWKQLGGEDRPVILIGREAGSGTRDGFESVVNAKDKCRYRQELTSTGDVIATVAGNPGAIGYASLASVKKTVKPLKVEGVEPSEKTVRDGTYAVQRPFVLVTKTGRTPSPAAMAFMEWALSSEGGKIISAAGAVPLR